MLQAFEPVVPQNLMPHRTRLSIPLPQSLLFQLIALETLGLLDPSALDFLSELGRWLSAATEYVHETAFLFQRLSVVIQRYNSVLIYESFGDLKIEPN